MGIGRPFSSSQLFGIGYETGTCAAAGASDEDLRGAKGDWSGASAGESRPPSWFRLLELPALASPAGSMRSSMSVSGMSSRRMSSELQRESGCAPRALLHPMGLELAIVVCRRVFFLFTSSEPTYPTSSKRPQL